MVSKCYIPRLSNDRKLAVQKNHLGGQIWYKSLDLPKKTASLSGSYLGGTIFLTQISKKSKFQEKFCVKKFLGKKIQKLCVKNNPPI